MTLREKIQESIINAGNNFYYDSEYSINRILDNATFPTAFMYLLQDSGIDRVGTQRLDKCNAQIVFSDLQDFDNTAITTDDIIEECILKAKFWLSTLQQNSNLELVQIISTKRIYSTFDVQLCGYLVNVQIRERYESKDCTNQPLTILEMLSLHTQQVATETQLGHIRSGGDISVDENGIVRVLNGGSGGAVDWDDITDKPTEFPPIVHEHPDGEVILTETYTGNLVGATTQKDANNILDALVGGVMETNLVASNDIMFDTLNQYGSITSARTGDITVNFTDAKLGIVQTMFHDALAIPAEILSNSKFVILQGYYTPDAINRISFELVDKTNGSEVILVSIIPCE